MDRVILHSDLNNFYASVECLYRPELREKPTAVAGDPQSRHGIVLAKNEIAKKFGVKTGEALWTARQKCPEIVFVPPNYERYVKFSKSAKKIYYEYTDLVESFGMDECWLDVTGSTELFGNGKEIADSIRKRIREELGLTVSVGVSFNKIFAKLGSDLKKPDATTVIKRSQYKSVVWPLPVSDLLFVGRSTNSKLEKYGIHTIGQLAETPIEFLKSVFGKNGQLLWQFANGLDCSPVCALGEVHEIKSIGKGITAPHDLTDDGEIRMTLYSLCDNVSAKLRKENFICRTVSLGIRDNSLHTIERQGRLSYPCRTSHALFEKAYSLFLSNKGKPVRSLTVRACDLERDVYEQNSFFPDAMLEQRKECLEQAVDNLHDRFGKTSVSRAVMLKGSRLAASLEPGRFHTIPFDGQFRR